MASWLPPELLAAQQAPSLRVTPRQLSSETLAWRAPPRDAKPLPGLAWRPRATTRGALIGGGVGLVLSALALVLYVEGTDPGNYSGPVVPIIAGATALGAVIGAAIGAGSDR